MSIRLIQNAVMFLVLLKGLGAQEDSIPEILLECYDDSVTLMPMTIYNLIEIIRKFESPQSSFVDMNIVVNSLIHRYWRDGIELDRSIIVLEPDVIPFKTTGFQSYKYELIIQNFIPKLAGYLTDERLSPSEKCTLHHMLSGSVDAWERGNEYEVCEIYHESKITNFETGFRKSSCPVEHGVIATKYYGTVSPIHIILGISTQLEPMNVPLSYLLHSEEEYLQNKSISNNRITLSGDLAETLIIQTPLIKRLFQFGPSGKWNDTIIPFEYYMRLSKEALQKDLWQYTDAEILGTLDGLIMAEEVKRWDRQNHILRLSQLLEAYYSKNYKSYSMYSHACTRKAFFEKLITEKKNITKQVQTFAEVLHQRMPNYLNSTSIIAARVDELISQFIEHAGNLLWRFSQCPEGVHLKSKLKLNIAVDNSWTSYERIKFLTSLGEKADVSAYGSQLTIIRADNGEIVMDSVKSIGELYLNWNVTNGNEVSSLVESLLSIRNSLYVKRKDLNDSGESFGHVTVILATSTILGNEQISDSITLLNSIRDMNPDMNFIYVTSSAYAPMFVKLTSARGSQTDKIVTADRNMEAIIDELGILAKYPMSIKPRTCGNSTKENRITKINGFANQGSILFYRIHPYYLCHVRNLFIEIENYDKGNLVICIDREEKSNFNECKEVSMTEKAAFNIQNPCSSGIIYEENEAWNENCKPVFMKIYGKRSLGSCTGWDCRMPDDIPFKISIEGLRCIGEHIPRCNGSHYLTIQPILFAILFLVILNNHIKDIMEYPIT